MLKSGKPGSSHWSRREDAPIAWSVPVLGLLCHPRLPGPYRHQRRCRPGRHESATIALWTVALRNKSRPHPRPFKPDFRFHTHTSKPTLTPFPHLPPLSPRTEPSPLGHHTRIQADRRVSVRFQSVCVYVLVSRTSERLCLSISYDIGCLMLFDLLVPFVSVSLAQADYPRSV